MNNTTYKIQLDVQKIVSQLSLGIPRVDTARTLLVRLVDQGKAYEIEKGCHAVFTAYKPDGTTIFNDCVIRDNSIEYSITPQTIACIGDVECEITLYGDDGEVLTSPRFSIVVYDAIRAKVDTDSATENLAIDDIIAREVARMNAESTRQDNEDTRIINERVRGIGEAYRIASINVLRAYLGGYDLPVIESPLDILDKIDSRLADASQNNFFFVNNDVIKSIAIIGDMISGDTDVIGLEKIEPNEVYFYNGLRFVGISEAIPEVSIFNTMEEKVKEVETSARKWATGSETETDEQHNNSAKDWANKSQALYDDIDAKKGQVNGYAPLERIEGEEYPKIPSMYINQIDIKEYKKITDEAQLNTIVAQKHDIAILVEPEYVADDEGNLVATGELVITKSWLLYDVAEDGSREWIKYGLSYATNAGYSTYANNAGNSAKINGNRILTVDSNTYENAVKNGTVSDTDIYIVEV